MARRSAQYYPGGSIFRAQLIRVHEDGSETWDDDLGPYATAAMAKGVSTSRLKWRRTNGQNWKVVIQTAELLWRDVD